MAYGGGAAAGAAAAKAIAQAIKASGAIIQVEPKDFLTILSKSSKPLVVTAKGGFFTREYQYLSAYKGLIFFTKAPEPLRIMQEIEMVQSKKIWIPR